MERLAELISKLKEQFEHNADKQQLLVITRMIEQELLQQGNNVNRSVGSSKISVVMPGPRVSADTQPQPQSKPVTPPPSQHNTPSPSQSQPTPPPQPQVTPPPPPPVTSTPPPQVASPTPKPVQEEKPSHKWNLDPLHDVPTLAQQTTPRELNETIANSSVSRNDQLKTEVMEVGHRLTDSPIRDLKKGIGVNDRYVFINELFRGDEVMYERSIKTINNFRIYAEAQYWIERELKLKLGWDGSKHSVKTFDQLVRRRFL